MRQYLIESIRKDYQACREEQASGAWIAKGDAECIRTAIALNLDATMEEAKAAFSSHKPQTIANRYRETQNAWRDEK